MKCFVPNLFQNGRKRQLGNGLLIIVTIPSISSHLALNFKIDTLKKERCDVGCVSHTWPDPFSMQWADLKNLFHIRT